MSLELDSAVMFKNNLGKCPYCHSASGYQYKMTVEYIQTNNWAGKSIHAEQSGNGTEQKKRFCITCGKNVTFYVICNGFLIAMIVCAVTMLRKDLKRIKELEEIKNEMDELKKTFTFLQEKTRHGNRDT